jgi:two-component system nitrogen regulation response regulator NtrX
MLQEQSFNRTDGARVDIDVRLIASTGRDLPALISAGRFREDLYYRLNVVPLRMPSLSERGEDVALLAGFFMEQAARSSGLAPRELGEDALAAMCGYAWPGNVRQLKNAIEWILIMAPAGQDDKIMANMLPPEIVQSIPNVLDGETGTLLMSRPLKEAREIFEREYLLSQVSRFGGNISRTAGFVGMERSALHRKLKLLGIQGLDREEKDKKGGVG